MPVEVSKEITRLLKGWGGGDRAVLDWLFPKVYDELRRMARRRLGDLIENGAAEC